MSKSMVFGYVRVSTKDQNIDRQVESLINQGVDERNIFVDKATGKNFERDGYKSLKGRLRTGDTLIVHELDRLGRNKKDTLEEIKWLKDTGIRFKALNLPTTMVDTKDNLMLDTINNIVIELYTMMAQQELEAREKRQREGIEQAKAKGVHMGRPRADFPKDWDKYYKQWKKGDITAKEMMDSLELKRTTFYKLVKKHEAI